MITIKKCFKNLHSNLAVILSFSGIVGLAWGMEKGVHTLVLLIIGSYCLFSFLRPCEI